MFRINLVREDDIKNFKGSSKTNDLEDKMFPLKEIQLCVDDVKSVKRNSYDVFGFSKVRAYASCELGAKASWG